MDELAALPLYYAQLCSTCGAALTQCLRDNPDHYTSSPYPVETNYQQLTESRIRGCPICTRILLRMNRIDDLLAHLRGDSDASYHRERKGSVTCRFTSISRRHRLSRPETFRISIDIQSPGYGRERVEMLFGRLAEFPGWTKEEPRLEILKELPRDWFIPPATVADDVNNVANIAVDQLVTHRARRMSEVATLCRQWLNVCESDDEHGPCRARNRQGWLPTRLIHIQRESTDGIVRARLHEAALTDYDSTVRYFTLSHRWLRQDNDTMHRTSNADELREDIPLSGVKAAIRDAILLCAELDVAYLWVDTLCICQNDLEEKEREIAAMDRVFGFAACNIAASNADKTDKGLFDLEDYSATNHAVLLNLHSEVQVYRMATTWDGATPELIDNILRMRGWVFQERFLSPRVLHCCAEQIHWECRQMEASETFPRGRPRDSVGTMYHAMLTRTLSNSGPDSPWQRWCELVTQYSERSFTFDNDRLRALAGVESFCRTNLQFKGGFSAGVWWRSFPEVLLWYRKEEAGNQRRLYKVAPTWSWASMAGSIHYDRYMFTMHSSTERNIGHSFHMSIAGSRADLPQRRSRLSNWRGLAGATTPISLSPSGPPEPIWVRGRLWRVLASRTQADDLDSLSVASPDASKLRVLGSEMIFDALPQPSPETLRYLPVIERHPDPEGVRFAQKGPYTSNLHGLLLELVQNDRHPVYERIGWCRCRVQGSEIEPHPQYPQWRSNKASSKLVLPGGERTFRIR